jgi:hypothetical protein
VTILDAPALLRGVAAIVLLANAAAAQPAPADPAPAGAKPDGPKQDGPKPGAGSAVVKLPPEAAGAVLGRRVYARNGDAVGVVIDLMVNGSGRPVAAVIDFGGFMGVGSHRVAIGWRLLHFTTDPAGDPAGTTRVTVDVDPAAIVATPEYQPGKDAFMLDLVP